MYFLVLSNKQTDYQASDLPNKKRLGRGLGSLFGEAGGALNLESRSNEAVTTAPPLLAKTSNQAAAAEPPSR